VHSGDGGARFRNPRRRAPGISTLLASGARPGAVLVHTVHRGARLTKTGEPGAAPRSSYAGSEVFIALVDGDQGPFHSI